ITASLNPGTGTVSGSTALHVTAATLDSLAITPPNPTIARFSIAVFHVTGTFSDHTTQDLTTQANWSSSDLSVATISNTVGSQGRATGTGAGDSTITATVGSASGTTNLHVTGAALQSISITPSLPTVANGLVVVFTATGTYSDSSTQNLTTLVT